MNLAKNLREARIRSGLSQEELAKKANVSQTLITHIERGLKIPSLPTGLLFAECLNTTLDDLCKGA